MSGAIFGQKGVENITMAVMRHAEGVHPIIRRSADADVKSATADLILAICQIVNAYLQSELRLPVRWPAVEEAWKG